MCFRTNNSIAFAKYTTVNAILTGDRPSQVESFHLLLPRTLEGIYMFPFDVFALEQ